MESGLSGVRSQNVKSDIAVLLRIIVSVALVVTGCTSQEAYLALTNIDDAAESQTRTRLILPEGVELNADTEITSPEPKAATQATRIDADPEIDFVRFRFDIDPAGNVSNVRVIDATKESLAEDASAILQSWEFEPASVDGKPVEMRNIEAKMEFTEREDEAGTTAAKVALLILLLPVVLVFSVFSQGSMDFDL